jgi:hypothetical protein
VGVHLFDILETGKLKGQEWDQWFPEPRKREELITKGHWGLFRVNRNTLYFDSGRGCTTVYICKNLSNCPTKIIYINVNNF